MRLLRGRARYVYPQPRTINHEGCHRRTVTTGSSTYATITKANEGRNGERADLVEDAG